MNSQSPRSHRLLGVLLTLSAATVALAGCASAAPSIDGAVGGDSAATDNPGSGAPAVENTSWGAKGVPGEPSMTLTAEGLAVGSDGCNTLSGQWRSKGTTLEFVEIAATEAFCADVDTWLLALATATVAGDTITFSDSSGTEIGSLQQTEFNSPG